MVSMPPFPPLKKNIIHIILNLSSKCTQDLANVYPDASVTAVDIFNSYTNDDIPANCTFTDCAIDQPLPFDDASFDFVFMRRTLLTVTKDIRNRVLLPEINRVLKPGGYFEWMASN